MSNQNNNNNTQNINCAQVNLRKSALATGLFSHEIAGSPTIGFVTEPHTAFKKVVGRPYEYNVFPEIAGDMAPRAALYIPKTIKSVGMPHLSNPDCQVALIFIQASVLLLASIYLDINDTPTPVWMERLIQVADEKRYGILLAMDSNAHSSLYGPNNNSRGDELEQFILSNRLWVANRGATPTFQTLYAESYIDITLTRDIEVKNWRVDTRYNASDHNTIRFEIDGVQELLGKEIRAWKQANWDKFKSSMNRTGYTIPEIITKKKLDKMVSYLYSRLEEALDLACPKILAKIKFKGSKWFDEPLKKLRAKIRRQYNEAKRTDTVEAWSRYAKFHKKFKYHCRKAKTKKWRHFVTETENEHMMSRLAKISQHSERAQLHTLQKEDGNFTAPGTETLEELAKVHFPEATQDIPHEGYSSDKCLRKEEVGKILTNIITEKKVQMALEKFHPYKAPGPDGIKAIAFKHLPSVALHFIYVIYLACLRLHYTPQLWQKATVVFLPKPNKPNYIRGKFFRPIVLSNVMLKGLERVITWRMDDMVKYYPIHGKQHGFTKGRSTESAISNTVDYIEQCIFRRQSCVGVFLDISSAYDSISIDHIRESLYKHGGDVDLVEWYYHYLSHRILKLHIHGESIFLHTAMGFPQGGVASAKFWLLAFDPAIQIINESFVEGNGYADDCCIVFGGRKPEIIIRRLQRVVDKLVAWGGTCGLRFNPDKTIVINFTRKIRQVVPHLRVGEEYVPFSTEALYLGIILDAKMYWRKHLEGKIKKGKRYLMKMANISKAIWGPKPNLSRWVFRCVVRPMMVYGSVCWAHSIDTPSVILKLRRINRLAMSTYTLFPRSTPTRAVEILSDTFPLHLWLQKEAICAFIRLVDLLPLTWLGKNNNKRRNTAHRRFWAEAIEKYEFSELLLEIDSCFALAPESGFVIRTDSFHMDVDYFRQLTHTKWRVYTDGSKKDGKVGAAFVIYRDMVMWKEAKFRLPDTATVFQAEIFAIFQATLALQQYEGDEGDCYIFSDSMSVLQSLRANEITKSIVFRTYKLLNKIAAQGYVISLFWIKAHVGIEGNERADELAKNGTEMMYVTYLPLPRSQIRSQVLNKLREVWRNEWEEYGEARHSKLFLSGPDKARGKQAYSLNRIDLRRLIMGITNHNNLYYHQWIQDDTINPTCRFCRMFDESFDHFFVCEYFEGYRRDHGIVWPFNDDDNAWTVSQIVSFINDTDIRAALDGKELISIGTIQEVHISDVESEVEERDFEEMDME